MPVALETFTAPYDGEMVKILAGVTIVADRHELARRYPQRFAPDGVRDMRQRSSAASPPALRTWDVGALPERRFRTRHAVGISRGAWNTIGCELDGGLESGGVLIGERGPDGSFLISVASGPGEGAARSSHAIRHDRDWYGQLEACYEGTGLRALGIWHSHPSGGAEPSETDLRSWNAASQIADDDTFLGVIVATDPDDPNPYRFKTTRAWTVIDGVCEPCAVFTPDDVPIRRSRY